MDYYFSGKLKSSLSKFQNIRHFVHKLLSVILLAILPLTSNSSWAECELKQLEIPVQFINQRPIAKLTLNGVEVSMLLDSGAFFSILTPSTAAQLNLPLDRLPEGLKIQGYTGNVAAKFTTVMKTGFRGLELDNLEFIVGGNEIGSGIQGILGRNILAIADTEYDLANGIVRIMIPNDECKKFNFAYWAGEAPVIETPLILIGRRDNSIRVKAKINGKNNYAILDTGAAITTFSLDAARKSGIEEKMLTPIGRAASGVGAGRKNSWIAPIEQIEIGDEKIRDIRLRIDDVNNLGYDVLLGLEYFLSHRIYVSRLQNKIYATWNGTPIFNSAGTKPEVYDTQYAAIPTAMAKDDADALARRGSAALAAKNYDSALKDLDQACMLAPSVAEYRYLRARVHLAMRQLKLALSDLNETLQLDPAHNEARSFRASIQIALNDRAAAQADLAKLDEILPPTSHLRSYMAESYVRLDQTSHALKQFDLWISSHQKDAELAPMLNKRCWIRVRKNLDLQLALQDCKDAIDKDEDEASYHDSLGWTYLRLNDAEQAKKAFDRALKLKTLALATYGRGLAKLQLNDKTGGNADLIAARLIEPKIDQIVRALGFRLDHDVQN